MPTSLRQAQCKLLSVNKSARGLPACRQGFTLVELLVVVSIIAILSVIGITVFSSAQKGARDAKRREDMIALKNAIAQYSLVNHAFPANGCSISSNGDWPASFKSALEPAYIQQVPKDPLNGQTSCSGAMCQYCFSANMWCSDSSTDSTNCNAGVANFYSYLENCSANSTGDATRFKYICPHFMKSIDPF